MLNSYYFILIKKSVLTTLLLMLLWTGFTSLIPKGLSTKQHQWNHNLIKAQSFLYEEDISDKEIILGTSLVNGIRMDMLPNNIINLAFGGQGVLDGLELILQKKEFPKRVYIESNLIIKESNKDFSKLIFSPFKYYSKKYIPILREKYQPTGVFKGLIQFCFLGEAGKNNEPEKKVEEKESVPSAIFELQKNSYSKKPDSLQLMNSIDKLKTKLSILQKNQVEIVFFEMPIHPELSNLSFSRIIRQNIKNTFCETGYKCIDQPDCKDYSTGDGVHLSVASLAKYSLYFNNAIEKL